MVRLLLLLNIKNCFIDINNEMFVPLNQIKIVFQGIYLIIFYALKYREIRQFSFRKSGSSQ